MKRRTCNMPGCTRKVRNKGRSRTGEILWGYKCQIHHKIKSNGKNYWRTGNYEDLPCEICGWKEATCDRHRKNKDLGYIEGNVVILCPNHHRLVTIGKLNLN